MTEIPVPQSANFQLSELHHVGIVVRDRDATIRSYRDSMGITSFFTLDFPMPHALVYGEPTPFDLRVGLAWLGNTLLELLQPLDRVSPHFHFLEEHGEGLHHLGFLVPNVDDSLAEMQGKGVRLLLESTDPTLDAKTVYLEGNGLSGVVLELMQESLALHTIYNQVYQALGRKNLPSWR